MIEVDLLTLLLLALVGLISGTLDAIAGGGGLITVPALLATGMPPAAALGTNKLQSCFGSFAATRYFYRQGLINLREMRLAIIATFCGSAAGTILVQQLDASMLSRLLPFLLAGFALYFLFTPNLGDEDRQQRIKLTTFGLLVGGGVGFYDGFFGPGTGSFFAIAFISLAGFGITKATANTKLLNFTSNIASFLFFALGGHMVWSIGLAMAAGQLLGGRIGSGLVVKQGAKLVRPLLVVMSIVLSLSLLWRDYPELFSWLTG